MAWALLIGALAVGVVAPGTIAMRSGFLSSDSDRLPVRTPPPPPPTSEPPGAVVPPPAPMGRPPSSAPTPSPSRKAAPPAKPAPPPNPPTFLFEVVRSFRADGPSGIRRTVTVNGRVSRNSTGFWVGCDKALTFTSFAVNGSFRRFSTTLALDPSTPAALRADVVVRGDGRVLARRRLGRGTTSAVRVLTTGVRTLVIEAQAVDPDTCDNGSVPYGIAFDGALRRR